MRPGEYAGQPNPNRQVCPLFRLQDIQLWIGDRPLNILLCPLTDLPRSTFATLTFTNQKNGVQGEVIGHDRSGQLHACPVRAIARRITHLRLHMAQPHTRLNAFVSNNHWQFVTAANITLALRTSATILGPTLGFMTSDVSARTLRAGLPMALL